MPNRFQVCYITDRRQLPPQALHSRIEGAIRAGVDLIQIREKDRLVTKWDILVQRAV